MISATVKTIQETPELRNIYSRLLPTAHLRDVAPAPARRARVVRMVEHAGRERILRHRLLIPDDAGHQPHHRVDEHERGQLTARQHVVTNRNLVGHERVDHALVDPFVAPAQHDDVLETTEALRDGVHIIVGTPGRVLDHIGRRTLDCRTISTFILDECDEMLSMGFLPQINDIFSFLPESKQTLLFSATLPADIKRMAETRLKNPEFVTLSGDHIGALEINHFVYLCPTDKLGALVQILESEDPESAVIFCNTRDETKRVATALERCDAALTPDVLEAFGQAPVKVRRRILKAVADLQSKTAGLKV